MKILVDLNVILDVLVDREPHVVASAGALSRIARGEIEGAVAGPAVTTIYYLLSKLADRDRADDGVDWLLDHLEVVPEDSELFRRARSTDSLHATPHVVLSKQLSSTLGLVELHSTWLPRK